MKKTLILLSVVTVLLLALTGCSGWNRNNTMNNNPADYDSYGDWDYTADENGMTNENGQNGTVDNRPGSTTGNGTMANNGTANNRPGSVAGGVQDAVDEAGNVVDDIADGAANAVDDATDAVRDAAGAVTGGDRRVTRPNSAA